MRHAFYALNLFAIFLMPLTDANGQDSPQLVGLASLSGRCERLVMAGVELPNGCAVRILQSIYENGRTSFTVLASGYGSAITFSGFEGAQPDADSKLQSVDTITLDHGLDEFRPGSTTVSGGCSYTNPYKGPMVINCQAVDGPGNAYLLQFRGDGSPPIVAEPPKSAAAESATATPPEKSGQGFRVGPWEGRPVKNDPDGGCQMRMAVDSKISVLVYANGNEGFSISIFNKDWNLRRNAKLNATLTFDGVPFSLSSVEVVNPQLVRLLDPGEEDSVEMPFERSREMVFKLGNLQIKAKLTKAAEATEALGKCVDARSDER